jgi:hypothetical protein
MKGIGQLPADNGLDLFGYLEAENAACFVGLPKAG